MESSRSDRVGPGFVFGLLLIAAGLSSLLERAHVLENVSFGLWWPIVPIGIGLAQIANWRTGSAGWMTLGFGLWSLVVVLTPIDFAETWPLLLLVWGASMIWRGLGGNQDLRDCSREETHAG